MSGLIKLSRGQIGMHVPGQGINLDITAKSATGWARSLAPTWDMVLRRKDGLLTDAEFTQMYYVLLDIAQLRLYNIVEYAYGRGSRCRFLCYCPDGGLCHTYLAIKWLVNTYPRLFEEDLP